VYEKNQINTIKAWKMKTPDVISQAVGLLSYPATRAIQQAIPETAILLIFHAVNYLANEIADIGDIAKAAGVSQIRDLKNKDLKLSDELSNSIHNWAIGIAVAQGGAAGAAGLVGLAADIPAIIMLALRTIHKIGLCYGYECRSEMDKNFALGILSVSGANSMSEKIEALETLRFIELTIAKQEWKTITGKAAGRQLSKEGGIIVIRNLVKQLGINITKRKAMQAVPVIGAVVGASVNGWYLKDVGWTARRSFQERWLVDNKKVKGIY
jgi:uncharacterized protein (DUF697 family)